LNFITRTRDKVGWVAQSV